MALCAALYAPTLAGGFLAVNPGGNTTVSAATINAAHALQLGASVGSIEPGKQADLIILNRALDGYPLPDMRDITSRIVECTNAAVLAVPETLGRFAFDRVLIAWDGGRSAAAALRAAVPLLALASEVEIFMAREADDEDMPNGPENAAAYLSRHGIHAAVKIAAKAESQADASIAVESGAWRADYIVMGAYGRGRLRETFGGVTKRMLRDSKLPLLLAH